MVIYSSILFVNLYKKIKTKHVNNILCTFDTIEEYAN